MEVHAVDRRTKRAMHRVEQLRQHAIQSGNLLVFMLPEDTAPGFQRTDDIYNLVAKLSKRTSNGFTSYAWPSPGTIGLGELDA